jgi:threonine dehydrogenase-like Zn-dependent dehydrogenase
MRAIYFDGVRIQERRMPKPRAGGEAVIKVGMAGICSTDLEITRGYMEFSGIPGHEFVGTVVSAPVKSLIGKRVVGEINVPCGVCATCKMGDGKHCPQRSVLGIQKRNGAFAEFLSLPVKNLHPVPADISDEEAVFTELVAAACEVPERFPVKRNTRIAVLGDGRLAAVASQVAAAGTKHVVVMGLSARKLSVIEKLGIETVDISRQNVRERDFDMVLECTGSPAGLPLAERLVRPRGIIVLKSTYHGRLRWNPSPIAVNEITVAGSRCGPFETALSMLKKRTVRVLPFLTAVYPFDDWRKALRRAGRRDSFKVLLKIT